uniref:Uncharacterized protein n=1 Tax=Mola mola TaxID=94237 RepID=A0A3Q4AII2_MOLML
WKLVSIRGGIMTHSGLDIGVNLGKKISVPKDVMMEELNLSSNRGSRMFLERQKRAERFTLENMADGAHHTDNVRNPKTHITAFTSLRVIVSFILNHIRLLVPSGYSGPLKNVPQERFNTTIIPKSYCSPWAEAQGGYEELQNACNTQLPLLTQPLQPANYRCFNSKRVIPVISLEPVESHKLPSPAQAHMCQRPNFNRAPKGWGIEYYPESNEL